MGRGSWTIGRDVRGEGRALDGITIHLWRMGRDHLLIVGRSQALRPGPKPDGWCSDRAQPCDGFARLGRRLRLRWRWEAPRTIDALGAGAGTAATRTPMTAIVDAGPPRIRVEASTSLDVEDLLHEPGCEASHEIVRFWWQRFGPLLMVDIPCKPVNRMRSFRQRWHADDVFVTAHGVERYPWWVFGNEDEIVAAHVFKQWSKAPTLRLLTKVMKPLGEAPPLLWSGERSSPLDI